MVETHGHCLKHVGRALLNGHFKYVDNQGDLDELYDLDADPYELKNLVEVAGFEKVVDDMRRRLAGWQERVGDVP